MQPDACYSTFSVLKISEARDGQQQLNHEIQMHAFGIVHVDSIAALGVGEATDG